MPQPAGLLIREGAERLAEAGLEWPRQDAELLLASILGCTRTRLLTHPETEVASNLADRFKQWIERRCGRHPIQYLTGKQEFYGRDFLVNETVLVPRPETELLVDVVLKRAATGRIRRVLDVGTGSGCIAVTLACECPGLELAASDSDHRVLEVARENARRHRVIDRIEFHHADSLAYFQESESFDLLVSNPPYVAFGDLRVAPEVNYEPRQAVYAGPTGLEMIRELLIRAPAVLRDERRLVLEIGADQSDRVVKMAEELDWRLESRHFDLAGIDRCLEFSWGPSGIKEFKGRSR